MRLEVKSEGKLHTERSPHVGGEPEVKPVEKTGLFKSLPNVRYAEDRHIPLAVVSC